MQPDGSASQGQSSRAPAAGEVLLSLARLGSVLATALALGLSGRISGELALGAVVCSAVPAAAAAVQAFYRRRSESS